MKEKLEESKAAETVFADRASGTGLEDVDQHVFFRVSGEKTRKDLDKFFFVGIVRSHESIADVKPMRPFAAIQSNPIAGSVRTYFIQPLPVLGNAGFDFLEIDGLRKRKTWKKECGC